MPCAGDRSSAPGAPLAPPRAGVGGQGAVRRLYGCRVRARVDPSPDRTLLPLLLRGQDVPDVLRRSTKSFCQAEGLGPRVQPHLTLLFPFTQGWIRRCLPSAGRPSLLPLPRATTGGGPQGHAMSATGQVRRAAGGPCSRPVVLTGMVRGRAGAWPAWAEAGVASGRLCGHR